MEAFEAVDRAVEVLQEKGYEGLFELRFDTLIDAADCKNYHASEFDVEEIHRFEETSGSFVLAIKTSDNRRGVLVDNYGDGFDPISIEMIDKFQLKNKSRKR